MLQKKKHHPRFVFIILLLGLFACRADSATWQRIDESGILHVGLDPTFPPFEVADDSELRGLDVDLAQALAGELGLTVQFVYFGYDGLYDALATGQVDVLISALVIVPERTRDFAYSEPYFNAGEVLIVRQEENEIHEMAHLNDKRLAIELGSLGHVQATQWANRLNNLEIIPLDAGGKALETVSAGQADAALVDQISGRLYLKEQPDSQRKLKMIEPPVTVEPYALVVRIEDETLLVKLEEALLTLKVNGELDAMTARWLDG